MLKMHDGKGEILALLQNYVQYWRFLCRMVVPSKVLVQHR